MKFVIDGKKDGAIGVIMTWEVQFHTCGIDYPNAFWKKLNLLFNKVDESQVMHIKKELISLNTHSFKRIEDYLACV